MFVASRRGGDSPLLICSLVFLLCFCWRVTLGAAPRVMLHSTRGIFDYHPPLHSASRAGGFTWEHGMVQGSTAVNRMPLCREHRKVIPGGRFRSLTKRARCGRTIAWKHQPIAWERCGSSPRHRISQAHRMLPRGDYQQIRGRRTSLPAHKYNGARNGAKVTRRGKGNGNPLARGAGTVNGADPHVAAWDGV